MAGEPVGGPVDARCFANKGSASFLAYVVGDLFLSRAFPASFFTLVALSKLVAISADLQAWGETGGSTLLLYTILQRSGMVVFTVVAVGLFIIRHPVKGKHSTIVGGLVALAGSFALSIPLTAITMDDSPGAMAASAVLTVGGAAFSIFSLVTLGRCFSIMPEARGLVTRGPYSLVRHPVYLGEEVSALGLVIATLSPITLAAFLVFTGLQVWRALNEEQVLREAFPEYEAYALRTSRFLPGIL